MTMEIDPPSAADAKLKETGVIIDWLKEGNNFTSVRRAKPDVFQELSDELYKALGTDCTPKKAKDKIKQLFNKFLNLRGRGLKPSMAERKAGIDAAAKLELRLPGFAKLDALLEKYPIPASGNFTAFSDPSSIRFVSRILPDATCSCYT